MNQPLTAEEFLKVLQEEFEKALTTKTNWGRNDLLLAYERAKTAALAKFIDMY